MKKEVIGLKFGRLTPIEYDHMEIRGVNNSRFHFYKCICDCGNEKVVNKNYLLTGDTKSCGCLYIKKAKTMNKKYRNSGHRKEYNAWLDAKRRCYDKNNSQYCNYGGRGVKMSEDWTNDFDAFFDEIGKAPTPKHQLDRINNDKGYESGNVRWVTPSENLINRRKKEHWGITYDGRSYYAKITRMYTERRSRALKTLEEAIQLRDLYVREYEEDEDKWIEDTITNNFKRTV